jgi:transposase
MRKERKHFTPEVKVAILRRHLVDKIPVSELCEELGLRPTVCYRWQKELFENGAAAFQSQERPQRADDFSGHRSIRFWRLLHKTRSV